VVDRRGVLAPVVAALLVAQPHKRPRSPSVRAIDAAERSRCPVMADGLSAYADRWAVLT
jgi:hypothetical protein